MEQNFEMLCDKFLEHVKKYSNKEEQQLSLEHNAYKSGIISKQNFDKLKYVREDKICTLNILGYYFKKLSLKTDDCNKYIDLLKSVINCIS